jgi:hypothetical protein
VDHRVGLNVMTKRKMDPVLHLMMVLVKSKRVVNVKTVFVLCDGSVCLTVELLLVLASTVILGYETHDGSGGLENSDSLSDGSLETLYRCQGTRRSLVKAV